MCSAAWHELAQIAPSGVLAAESLHIGIAVAVSRADAPNGLVLVWGGRTMRESMVVFLFMDWVDGGFIDRMMT